MTPVADGCELEYFIFTNGFIFRSFGPPSLGDFPWLLTPHALIPGWVDLISCSITPVPPAVEPLPFTFFV